MTFEVVLMIAFCLLAWGVFGRLVPNAVRDVVLCSLHERRGALYNTARDFPAAYDTYLYRRAEVGLSLMICILRERDLGGAFAFYKVFQDASKREVVPSGSRLIVENELRTVFVGIDGHRASKRIADSVLSAVPLMGLYGFLGGARYAWMSVFVLVLTTPLLIAVFIRNLLTNEKGQDDASVRAIALERVEEAERVEALAATPIQALRTMKPEYRSHAAA